ncbi:class I adenylate-forming enzyme family protein [Nocardiopsis alkaliphila]|uniref:class I adenylate-forming enzyme family protein n=1 Tax=Nocardiopsis alkaliphila TaxID=225762 RepID=UPI00034A81AF|nr:class I adenylate-forming enzyme family protein [Nocardiopsis alkaliphila]
MGKLFIDGEEIPRSRLQADVRDLARALVALGAGPGKGVILGRDDPYPAVVTALVAEEIGTPVLCQAERWRSLTSTRRVVAVITPGDAGGPVSREVPGTDRPDFSDTTHTILYTSGSSGEPKAVELSRGAMDYHRTDVAAHAGVSGQDRMLVPMSLLNSYGWGLVQYWLSHGFEMHVESRLSMERVIERLSTGAYSTLDGVGSMYAGLLAAAKGNPALVSALSALRFRGCGGDMLPVSLVHDYVEVVGGPIHDGYGLSETVAWVTQSVPHDWRYGTVGPLIKGSSARIDSRTGEVHLHGPGLMDGYLDEPAANAETFTEDGWLRTGDRGSLTDDGHLVIEGRIKESLVVHGETFPPRFVEDVLTSCTRVIEAVVVGVPTGKARGDRLVAFAVVEPGREEEALEQMRAALNDQLAVRFRPRQIRLINEMPRTRTDKADRRALRARVVGPGSP